MEGEERAWSYSRRLGGSTSSGWARSRGWPASWGFTEGWSGRRWPARCPGEDSEAEGTSPARGSDRVHRRDPGGGQEGAEEAASHGTADPRAHREGASGVARGRVDRAPVCAGAQGRDGAAGQGDLRVPELLLGGRRARLTGMRPRGSSGRTTEARRVCPARHGEWGSLPPGTYYRATQQAFLEAHQLAFHYFGGVFRRLRLDYVARHIIQVLCPA